MQGVTATIVEVRRPPSRSARSPRMAPGPTSASALPSTSMRRTPSSSRNSSSPDSPCLTSASPCLILRFFGLAPPRMIVVDSWRSRAVSTCVVTAGESSSPQGLWVPNARSDQLR